RRREAERERVDRLTSDVSADERLADPGDEPVEWVAGEASEAFDRDIVCIVCDARTHIRLPAIHRDLHRTSSHSGLPRPSATDPTKGARASWLASAPTARPTARRSTRCASERATAEPTRQRSTMIRASSARCTWDRT